MLLYENKKIKLLNYLKIGLNPFKNFVSTGEIEEKVGVVSSRKDTLQSIVKLTENHKQNFILPIIASVGVGKTHLFWSIKKKLYYYNTVYISLENVYRKFYYNIYSEFLEEMGVKVLRSITNELCNKWGAQEKKFGFFHVADIEKVKEHGYSNLNNNFENNDVLKEVISVIVTHQLDPYKKIEAENWLLGELMDYKNLSRLNLSNDLKKNQYAFTLLKIIIENSKLGSVLYIDDFERLIGLMKSFDDEVESDENNIYSSSWLYGNDESPPEKIKAQKILDKILKLLHINGLKVIITLKSEESLDDIKKIIQEKNPDLLSSFIEPITINNFNEYDLFQFYRKNMKSYLEKIHFLEFLEDNPKELFPLNEKILSNIYMATKGNPREIIKNLIKIFNLIIYSDEDLNEILNNFYV
ncbi:MAG: hypothetical protein ACFFBP_08040 [Promethearchaeota archaeon]